MVEIAMLLELAEQESTKTKLMKMKNQFEVIKLDVLMEADYIEMGLTSIEMIERINQKIQKRKRIIGLLENCIEKTSFNIDVQQSKLEELNTIRQSIIKDCRQNSESVKPFCQLDKDVVDFEKKEEEIMGRMRMWCGKQNCEIIFDTDVCGWERTNFQRAVMNKKDVSLLVFTKSGDAFGCYYNLPIQKTDTCPNDEQFFMFTIQINETKNKPTKWKGIQQWKHGLVICSRGDYLFYDYYGHIAIQSKPNRRGSYIHSSFLDHYEGNDNVEFLKQTEIPILFQTQRVIAMQWS